MTSEIKSSTSRWVSSHNLIRVTFSNIQTCQHCGKYLLGLVLQGYQCQVCEFICHPNCIAEVNRLVCDFNHPQHLVIEDGAEITPISVVEEDSTELVMENLLDLIEAPEVIIKNEPINFTPLDSDSKSYTIYSTPGAYSLESYLRDIIELTEEHERTLEKKRNKSASDMVIPLVHNFTQFLLKVTGVRILFNYLFDIVTWKKPHHTILAIICHTFLCLYPSWLLICSFIAMWSLIYINHYQKTTNSESSPNETEEIKLDFEYPASVRYYLASLGFETAILSAVMAKNPRNVLFVIQLMETHLYIHDNSIIYLNKIKSLFGPKWSSWVTIICLPGFLLVTQIPFRYLLLLGGAGGIIFNHPVIRAIIISTIHFISHNWDLHFTYFVNAFKEYRFSGIFFNHSGIKVAKVYQNQRWWAISGWSSRTLTTEREGWSDETGQITYENIKHLAPLTGYQWAPQSQWELNKDWIYPIKLHSDGWVYGDNEWNNPNCKPQLNSYTRRRLWFRKMLPIINPDPTM